jgi:hypothetical protein
MMIRALPRQYRSPGSCKPAVLDYLLCMYSTEVRIMRQIAIIPILGAALVTLAACSSEPDDARTSEEHVWKEQTGAIDKAREVETILKRGQDQETQ